VKVVRRLG